MQLLLKVLNKLGRINRYVGLRNQRGQSMVETALVLPIILLILMAIIEFGRIFNAYLIITNASREGARCAVVGGTDSSIVSTINTAAASLEDDALNISIEPSTAGRLRGVQVAVELDYSVELVSPIIASIIPNPFPLSSKTVMRME